MTNNKSNGSVQHERLTWCHIFTIYRIYSLHNSGYKMAENERLDYFLM